MEFFPTPTLEIQTELRSLDYSATNLPSLELFSHFLPDAFVYRYATNHTFIFVSKLSIALIFLSAIRGGVPRYRYDFLTKMGWVKFLGLVLSVFLIALVLMLAW